MLILRDAASAAALLIEAGQGEELVEAILEEDDAAWTVEFATGVPCEVRFLDTPARLALTAGFGRPGDTRLAAVQAQALAFNLLGEETGGCRIARDPEDGEFFLLQEIPAAALEGRPLGEWLLRFEALRAWWDFVVRAPAAPAQPSDLRAAIQGLFA